MNRPGVLPLAAVALLGAGPAPLVVGSVHDQHGLPIAQAQVTLVGSGASGMTAADGTFAIAGSAKTVVVRCAYCRTTDAGVASDGTVVAIVVRYDAVRREGPSAEDLTRLPYTRAESDVALTPFVVLEQSSLPFEGASLHDRSISTSGGLLVLDGIPDYNNASGMTTFDTIPYDSAASVDVARSSQAYTYGDVASSGTFTVNTLGGTPSIALGSNGVATFSSDNVAAGYSSANDDERSRATAELAIPLPQTALRLMLSSGSGMLDGNLDTLQSAFSALNLSAERTTGTDAYADFIADRGSDGYTSPSYDANDTWSNVDAILGVRSHAVVAPFAQIEWRQSNGWLWTPSVAPYVAGTTSQKRAYAGVDAELPWYSARVVYGLDAVNFVQAYPTQPAASVAGHDAAATLDLHPLSGWNLTASTSSGYLLQTVLGYYESSEQGYSPIDQQSTDELDLAYSDVSRLRIGLTSFSTRTASGIDDHSAGVESAWQVAPDVSVRAWWLDVHPHTGAPQTVGSAWLQMNSGAIRFDLIWRRDLLDLAGNEHLDGSISGPLGARTRWFMRSEEFARIRSTDVGISL